MKRFRELTEGLGHQVPVYHADRKTLVGHVPSSSTSIGAAKLAKKKSASFERVNGKYGWVASGDLKESKYGDAMSSRLPAHLDNPQWDKKDADDAAERYKTLPRKGRLPAKKDPKNPTWKLYREEAKRQIDGMVLVESAELNIPEHTTQEIANKHGFTVQHIEAQLERGIKVEGEHTTHVAPAREIALDHLWENPNYYTVLKKAQLEGCLLEEGRTPKDKTLQGHPYHHKSDAELHYIMKDAAEAEKAIGSHDKTAMWKYGDQQNDAASVLAYRRRGGKQIPAPIKEELTPREKMSGDERLKPVKPAPVDHAEDQKKALKTQFSYKKFAADRIKHPEKFIAGLTEGSNLPFHKYTNDELDAAIKYHADSATELRRFDRKSHAAYQHIQHAHAAREILKSRKRNLRNYGMDEAYDMAFNESGAADHLAQFSHHWAQFKLHNNLSDTDRTHLTKRNHHEQEMNKHYKNLTTQQKNALRLTESVESYKVGDKVIPKIGPHKGTVHTVIHVHPTGHLNIKPEVHVRSNRYHLGAAKADPKDVDRAPLNEEYSQGMYFHAAVKHAKQHGNRVTFGTASKKWHSIDPTDRDYHTSWALDPDEATRQGEAKSFLHSTATRHLEEATIRRTYYANMQKKDPAKFLKNRGKLFKKNIPGLEHLDLGDEADRSFEKQERARGINRKTIQEIFQAAKDKKNGKPPQVDALPNDGANEPKQEVPGVQPQDAKGPQDGAPGAEKKKDNTPVPENASKSKKIQVKGAGPDDKFQDSPIVTPLTHMPDTGNPRNGSAATR